MMPGGPLMDAKGLMVTVGGRRVSRVKMLEDQVAELVCQTSSLSKENAGLRARETMQMQLLSGYEDMLVQLGTVMMQTADTDDESSALTTALMLDLQAQELMGHLKGPGSSSALVSSSSNSSDDQHGPPAAGRPLRRSQRLWATITLESVLGMQGISTVELAGRFKACLMRLALIKQCSNPARLIDDVESAMDAVGQLILLSLVAAGEQQLEMQCLNFETMQQEAPADGIWTQVVDEMQLTPEQRRKVHTAFECYKTQRASLLQQQHQLVQELRDLLSPAGALPSPCSQDPAQHTGSISAASPSVLSHANNYAGTAMQTEMQAKPASAGASSAGSPGAAAVDSRSPAGTGEFAATPLAVEHLLLAAPAAAGVLPQPFCASGGSGAATGSGGCSGGEGRGPCKHSGSSSSSLVPGTIDLNAAMRAEVVLEMLDRNTRLQRSASRQLILFYIDLLATEQHANALLAAYPYSIRVPAVLSLIFEQETSRLASPGKKVAPGK